MPVGPRHEDSAIRMPQPLRNRLVVDTLLDCVGREEVPERVNREIRQTGFLARQHHRAARRNDVEDASV